MLLAMSARVEEQFEGNIPFPAFNGDLDLDELSDAGAHEAGTTAGDECGGASAPIGTQVSSAAPPASQPALPDQGNNAAPTAPRRRQPACGNKNGQTNNEVARNDRNALLADLKKSFDDLQASKKNISFNERWGALLGIQINDLPVKVQENFRFYVQCLAISVRRGSVTLPDAHHVLRGNWALEVNMDSASEDEQ